MRGLTCRLLAFPFAIAVCCTAGAGLPGHGARGEPVRAAMSVSEAAVRPWPGAWAAAVPAPVAVPVPSRLLPADLLVVAPSAIPATVLRAVRRLGGVAAAVPVDAGRIQVNGVFTNILGVSPAAFRPFAARPTALSDALWSNVAAGGMAISYPMGHQEGLAPGALVQATGTRALWLPVAGLGTVGIAGVDAIVSEPVASSLGLPSSNAIVISAPHAPLAPLMTSIRKMVPAQSAVAALVTQVTVGGTVITSGSAGDGAAGPAGPGLTAAQTAEFLAAARSRLGMPYVWGGDGPTVFDCSGLVQWAMAQAGVTMPRVAADQARSGPAVAVSHLRPGDLLFYRTDPTAPGYISHVAIYLGNGLMLQAPQPGMNVQIVPAYFGAGFAGAVRVYPRVAAAVAANPVG